ncbi:MAG TPA: tetratricopeptide repeat protein [Treponemataceae bacterium]|nr:tetratricopeptide repeat protein [Treponemataceae bacterium]
MITKQKNIAFLCFLMLCGILFATAFEEGERLFSSNRPLEAIPYFQKTLLELNPNPKVYTYLGVSYMQTGQSEKALEIFKKGLTIDGTNKKELYFNAGNVCFTNNDYKTARELYSYAISADSLFAPAYLNRANTYLKLQKYKKSIDDYTNYLALYPDSEQKENIIAMINALNNEIQFQAEEAQRLAAEEERIKEAQKRFAAEKAEQDRIRAEEEAKTAAEQAKHAAEQAAADAARRKKLLEEVAAELQQTESINLTAGTEGVIDYIEEESDLD